jgi:transposase
MRFYTGQHRFHCGVDLHAHTMAVCVLDATGEIVLERNLATTPEAFLEAIAPYREGLVVACECIFTWYWLADLCAKEQIPFVLGHALYMKAIHGGKAKNDRIDAHKIAVLLRGGLLPQAYVYPPGMRETRDLLRRRLHLVRKRGQLLAHLQNLRHTYNRAAFEKRIAYPSNREGVVAHFAGEPMVQANAALDLSLLAHYDKLRSPSTPRSSSRTPADASEGGEPDV